MSTGQSAAMEIDDENSFGDLWHQEPSRIRQIQLSIDGKKNI